MASLIRWGLRRGLVGLHRSEQALKGFPSRFWQGLSQLDGFRMSIHAKNEFNALAIPTIPVRHQRKIGIPAQRDLCGTRAH